MTTVTGSYTCFWDALSLLFGRSMSELVLKEAERGGHKSDLSFLGEPLVLGVRI